MPSGALFVALGALGFAADPATWDAAWEFVNADLSPSPMPAANAVYRMIKKYGDDVPERLTPSVQDYFWTVLCNFEPVCVDAWRAKATTPSPSPQANGWWHDAWATRESHHARDPESYADDIYDYDYSTNLYYWDGDETP